MYIWILLATIMMMFSFYNLAPRTDKENSIVEVKAATVVNRFRAESAAFMKAFECQAILSVDPKETGWKNNEYVFPQDDENTQNSEEFEAKDQDYGYTKYSDNLPIGYKYSSDLKVTHTVVCLNNPIDKEGVGKLNTCGSSTAGTPIYMISFAPIPEQWVSKTNEKYPTPELVQYISDANSGGITYGWVACKNGEEGEEGESRISCQLHGYHSRFADVEDTGTTDEQGQAIQKRIYKQIHTNFWQYLPGKFQGANDEVNNCVYKPCLFAFHRVPFVDYKGACRKIIEKYNQSVTQSGGGE